MSSSLPLAYWLMPEELIFPIALMLGLMGLFLRLIGLRRLGGSMLFAAVGLAVLPILLGPLLEEILMQVPQWVVVVFLVALGFYLVRLVLTLFLGKEGAGTLLAMAVAGSLRKMGALPGLISKWTLGLGAFLHSANPGKRVFGIALAILLAVLAGLGGRQLGDNSLFPWNLSTEDGGAQTASFLSPSTTPRMEEGQWSSRWLPPDTTETGSAIYRRVFDKAR